MWNASSEEQQALKHFAKCVKITVDLTREEQPVSHAQKENTGGPTSFTVGS